MIVSANKADMRKVVDIQKGSLPNDLISCFSDNYLIKHFYPKFINRNSIFMIHKKEDEILGYIIIIKDTKYMKYKLLSYFTFEEVLKYTLRNFRKNIMSLLGICFPQKKVSSEYKRGAEIYFIAVTPLHHNKGIGSQLLLECINKLRAIGEKRCIVKTSSNKAEQFYIKNGFKYIGREKRANKIFKILGMHI